MARKVQPELRAAWRKRIALQAESGLSVREFCSREGVSQASFYLWKRKLQASAATPRRRNPPSRPAAVAKRPYRKASDGANPVAFVQVPLPPTPGSPWIEVALAEGTIIRIPQQNMTAVQTILRTLAGRGTLDREELRHA